MEWLFFALLAPVFWGFANILDKVLLDKYFKSPYAYQTYLVTFNILAVFLFGLFFTIDYTPMIAFAGVTFGFLVTAIFVFYNEAVKREDISKVVTLYYLNPLLVAFFAFMLLGERLSLLNYSGILVMVAGAALMTYKKSRTGSFLTKGVAFILLFDVLWALAINGAKWAVVQTNWWTWLFFAFAGGFLYVPVTLLIPWYRKEIKSDWKGVNWDSAFLLLLKNALFFIGLIAFYIALSSADVSLVGAVPSIQPLIVLVLVLLLSKFWPSAGIKESLNKAEIMKKGLAVALLLVGTVLLLM